MTNINFSKWGQGIQCDHQYGTALLGTFVNFYTVLKTMGNYNLDNKTRNIHTNTLGKYYTYFIHVYTFHPDVLKVNSQQIKGSTVWLCTCIWVLQ